VPLSAMTIAIAPAGLVGLVGPGLFAATVMSLGPALALILIGAGLGQVGTDLAGVQRRFRFGILELRDGIGFVPRVMSIFGLAEIIRALETSGRPQSIAGVRWPGPTRGVLRARGAMGRTGKQVRGDYRTGLAGCDGIIRRVSDQDQRYGDCLGRNWSGLSHDPPYH
jgi:hypothetical protein